MNWLCGPELKELSNTGCVSAILGEICDNAGTWHTGFLPYGKLAELIGTTTADLMRRLKLLGIVEYKAGRHRLTRTAILKRFGMVYRKGRKGDLDMSFDVILPEGMVEVVTHLKATNLPETEIERMNRQGLSQRTIATRIGMTQQAVSKHLKSLPPRLANWPITGTWNIDEEKEPEQSDNQSVLAA